MWKCIMFQINTYLKWPFSKKHLKVRALVSNGRRRLFETWSFKTMVGMFLYLGKCFAKKLNINCNF